MNQSRKSSQPGSRLFKKTLAPAVISLGVFLLINCGGGAPAVSDAELKNGVVPVTTDQALVVFFSGEVSVQFGGAWRPMEIGGYLVRGQRVRVGRDSSCELQFGARAVVVLEEQTELAIDQLLVSSGSSDVQLGVEAGSLLCKVYQLGGKENFQVKTKSAVCGVRGTEFRVAVGGDSDTTLAVKKGQVYVLPAGTDLGKWRGNFADAEAKMDLVMERLENNAPVVSADQELTVTQASLAAAEKEVEALAAEMENLIRKEKPTDEDWAALETTAVASVSAMKEKMPSVQALSETQKETLKRLEEATVVPVSVKTAEASPAGAESTLPPRPVLVKVEIATVPADAEIFISGRSLGRGKLQGIYAQDAPPTFVIRREGYEEAILAPDLKKAGEKKFSVMLKKLENDASSLSEPEKTPNLNSDAVPHKEADEAAIITDEQKVEKRPLLFTVKASASGFIGELASGSGLIYGADRSGVLYAVNDSGKIVWKQATGNNPNNNSSPLYMDGRVYFSGLRELLITDARSGAVLGRVPLEGSYSHIFGRRIAKSGQYGILPADDGFRLINLISGAAEMELPLPSDSRMTPTIFRGKLYLVDTTGRLQIIDPRSGEADPEPLATGAVEPVAISITVAGNRGYFADRRNQVFCVDLAAKKTVWQKKLESSEYTYSDLIAGDRGVYVFAGKTIFGFGLNGQMLFKPLGGMSAPPVAAGGNLYAGSAAGKLLVLDPQSGAVRKSLELKRVISARPVAVGPKIAVGTNSGELLLIDPEAF